MKEKELRLALVLFGGVSLAVYQHGINRELLNLARASRAYHRVAGSAAKQAPGHAYPPGAGADAWTAEVYFDLLKRLGRRCRTCACVVDVIRPVRRRARSTASRSHARSRTTSASRR